MWCGSRGRRWASAESRQEQAARDRASAVGDDGDLGRPGDLAFAGFAPQLQDGFVDVAVAVEATAGELAPVGVERKLAIERDPLPTVDERAALAVATEAEGFEPGHGEPAEPVVEE